MSETVLKEAERVVHGDRNESYGNPIDNHSCTARLISAYLQRKYDTDLYLDAEDVCMLNILQKVSREANTASRDNLVDICGYAANVELIHDARERRREKG